MGGYQKGYKNKEERKNIVKCKDIHHFSEGLAPIKQGKLWGYINTEGEIAIPCMFSYVYEFSEGLAAISDKSGLEGYINKKGEIVIPCQYKHAGTFKEGLAYIEDNETSLFGIIDQTGKIVVPCRYTTIGHFSEGLAIAGIAEESGVELLGYIDREGQTVIDFKYLEAFDFSNGFAKVEYDFYDTILNKQGEEILKLSISRNDFIHHSGEGLVIWQEKGVPHFKNLITGFTKTLPSVKEVIDIKDGLCIIQNKNGKYGAIGQDGEEIIPFTHTILGEPSDERIIYQDKAYFGYLNYKGEIAIPAIYDAVRIFSSGFTHVSFRNKELFIDKKGEVVFNIKLGGSDFTLFLFGGTVLFWVIMIILMLL